MLRYVFLVCSFCFINCQLFAQNINFLNLFTSTQIKAANTAKAVSYLSIEEKKVFLIINLARMNPQIFNEVLINYKGIPNYSNDFIQNRKYVRSLSKNLLEIEALEPIYPSKELWLLAKCHAIKSGKKGLLGHKRTGCKELVYRQSECCSYGLEFAVDIVIQLLIDHNIVDLGHRKIILDKRQRYLGVSIKSHKQYRYNAVLDFSF
ncbi:MAG: CAP domain-containing protein [Flavobacteriales bacterium TMED191]|nr:MAG: CAP domain-containing protein [Flavobacteriales bacterium TMED191]|tara:strand:+ start:395 stop:1012 length:618 start_codon:yes stop_codon:yes gene_type:complete